MLTKHTAIRVLILLSMIYWHGAVVCAQELSSFAEFGTTLHAGDYTPLWQVSNQHGLASFKNNAYLRGAAFYKQDLNKWALHFGADLAVGAGLDTWVIPQQLYVDVRYRWAGIWAGCREIDSALLDQELSSGGLTWSGNARPVPQVCFGIPEYTYLSPAVQLKAEIAFGWFCDGKYQKRVVGEEYAYAKSIKYHHKSLFLRFGKPISHWQFDIGMQIDNQFGGYSISKDETIDLGNTWKEYFTALIPYNRGEGKYFEGNFLGSEHLKITYKHSDYRLSAYLENFFEDFSGMAKQNGFDGLWGISFHTTQRQVINDVVMEYYQTTDQSGPLHGLDFSEAKKTGGADNYYNHAYSGWTHWGMMNSNPLIVSNRYNKDGFLSLRHTRIKAFHLGWKGDIARQWSYRAKISFNRSWGTPFYPTLNIYENFSSFFEVKYQPLKLEGWSMKASFAFDTGSLYGDNLGFQLKIRRDF